MDFSQFDNKKRAEDGFAYRPVHPDTGEALVNEDGSYPVVHLRGALSSAVQNATRERIRAMKAKKAAGPEADDEVLALEDIHQQAVENALPYIIGFENVIFDGKPLTNSDADKRRFLEVSRPVLVSKLDDGKMRQEVVNQPFTRQIVDAATEYKNFQGNA